MNRRLVLPALGSLALAGQALAADAPPLRRFALVAGTNVGSADRPQLRFALQDAERFARVMRELGGVLEPDCIVLREPTRRALLDAFAVLRGRSGEAHAAAQRSEVVFYFSGHADDGGLLLGRERIQYSELRDILAGLSSDVRIAVLDACASGAITRFKGGRSQPAFLSDVSSQVRGHAFLTSSAESEAAQESDRLQGSFFTHALLSGLRGGADVTGDGKVTLNEAYQFAFQETMARTASTQGGTQHPTYDIKMAGTGDVVLTDLRGTNAAIVLGPDLDGRFFVRDAGGALVAELQKPLGRGVELGVEPGPYEVSLERPSAYLRAKITLASGERRAVGGAELRPAGRRPTRLRGPGAPDAWARGRRSRLDVVGGASGLQVRTTEAAGVSTDEVSGADFELGYSFWVRHDLSLDLAVVGQDLDITTTQRATAEDSEERVAGSYGAFLGARYYVPIRGSVRPFVLGGVGALTDWSSVETPTSTTVSQSETDFALRLGGGVEVTIGAHASLALRGLVTRRDGRSTRSGALGFGWSFGHGR